jgi:hypothetical protein
VRLLSQVPAARGVLRWRPLGTGKYREVPLEHVARGVYRVDMKNPGDDFEYQVVVDVDGTTLVYPASEGQAGQSVVVEE